jgi:hypothetical protein
MTAGRRLPLAVAPETALARYHLLLVTLLLCALGETTNQLFLRALDLRRLSEALAFAWLLIALRLRPQRAPLVAAAGAFVLVVRQLLSFPQGANHGVLLTIALVALAVPRADSEEETGDALAAAALLALLVVFWAGAQKLLHRGWCHGEYLAYAIAARDWRFTRIGWLLLPAAELSRVRALYPLAPGAGPLRLTTPLALVISNLVPLGEVALPLLALVRALRPLALAGLVLMIVGVEAVAREVSFGLILLALLALLGGRRLSAVVLVLVPLSHLILIAAKVAGGTRVGL